MLLVFNTMAHWFTFLKVRLITTIVQRKRNSLKTRSSYGCIHSQHVYIELAAAVLNVLIYESNIVLSCYVQLRQ